MPSRIEGTESVTMAEHPQAAETKARFLVAIAANDDERGAKNKLLRPPDSRVTNEPLGLA